MPEDRVRRRVQSWEDWRQFLRWEQNAADENAELGGTTPDEKKLEGEKVEGEMVASGGPVDAESISSLSELADAYCKLEDAVMMLWCAPENHGGARAEMFGRNGEFLVGVPEVSQLEEMARRAVKVNLENHKLMAELGQRMGSNKGKSMVRVGSQRKDAFCRWVWIVQENPKLVVSAVGGLFNTNQQLYEGVMDTLLNGIYHPFSISEKVSLEFLGHLFFACSLGVVCRAVVWDALVACGKRCDLIEELLGIVDFVSVESVVASIRNRVPQGIVRICQLLHASRSYHGVSVTRFIFEAWLVPLFLKRGNKAVALKLSQIGFFLEGDNQRMAPDGTSVHLLQVVSSWVESIWRTPVATPSEFPTRDLCHLVVLKPHSARQLFGLYRVLQDLVRKASKEGTCFAQGSAFYALETLHLNDIDHDLWIIVTGHDQGMEDDGSKQQLVGWRLFEELGWRLCLLKSLLARVEEVLAREALLKDSPVAGKSREREILSLAEECGQLRHEAYLAASYSAQLASLLRFVSEISRTLSRLLNLEANSSRADSVHNMRECEAAEDIGLEFVANKIEKSEEKDTISQSNVEDNEGYIDDFEDLSSGENDNPERDVEDCFSVMQTPEEFLEKIFLAKDLDVKGGHARVCLYSLSPDRSCIISNSQHTAGSTEDMDDCNIIFVNDIIEAEMGLADSCSPYEGIRWSSSLGCCFYLKTERGDTYQLVSKSEDLALSWVFGCQQLSSHIMSRWSPREYANARNSSVYRRKSAIYVHEIAG